MTKDWSSLDTSIAEEWDAEFADALLGSYVLLGITYRDPDGTVIERRQLHGYVRGVDPQSVISVRPDGEDADPEFNLPPSLDAFERAEEGIYTNDAGEVVRDPDFVAYRHQAKQLVVGAGLISTSLRQREGN